MIQNKLSSLQDFCGGRAEAETSFLTEAFVLEKDYQDALHSPFHSPVLLLGRKGSGKSALLKFIDLQADKAGIQSLYLKPDNMPMLDGIGDAIDTATIKRRAYEALLSEVAVKVGSQMRGLLNRKDKKLFDKAIKEGARSHDSVQACLHALINVGSIVQEIDFSKLIPKTTAPTSVELQQSLKQNFSNAKHAFFLLLDDIDQVAALPNQNQVNRIWGLILAAQRLTEELPNFKTIISLRTEVWKLLIKNAHGQRDQVDHVRPLLRRIDPDENQIKSIIERRLEVSMKHLKLSGSPISIFFEGNSVVLPTSGDETRSWPDFIAKSSRGRPRDALQLLWILADESRKKKYQKISQSVVNHSAEIYSTQRIDDLSIEYANDCSVTREICNSFCTLKFIMPTDDLKKHLIALPSRFNIIIRKVQIHPESIDEIFELWKFVHEIGLCNPRIPDIRQERKFRHISFDDDPNFIKQANWNEMQKVAWEIHPAYRSHFIKMKKDDEARAGVSLKSFFK